MTLVAFDTLKTAKRLEAAGIEPQQAEALIESLKEIQETYVQKLATKDDIKDVRQEIKDVRQEIKNVRSDLEKLEMRMTIKLGTMIGIAVVLIKFFDYLFPAVN